MTAKNSKKEGKSLKIELQYLVERMILMTSDIFIHILIFVVIFDILSGLTKSFLGKATESTKGLTGLIKHALVVILCLFIYPYLQLLGFQMEANAFIIFFITTYSISIVENLGMIGIPLPQFIKENLVKLRNLSDDNRLDR